MIISHAEAHSIIIPEEIIPASNTGQYLKQIDYAGQTISFVYIEDKVKKREPKTHDFCRFR